MKQRLNLPHILQNQLAEDREQGGGILKMLRSMKKDKNAIKFSDLSPVDRNYFSEKPDVIKTFDKMVSNIHTTMKSIPPPLRAVPSIPAPIAGIPVTTSTPTTVRRRRISAAQRRSHLRSQSASCSRSITRSKSSRFKGGSNSNRGSSAGVVTNSKFKTLPISAMKATLDQKVAQMKRRGLKDIGGKTFVNQRRIREVLQQKVMLEQMLLQHKRLLHDRQTIALDIQRMRQDLEKIRNKLDNSLQSLTTTRTMAGPAAKAKKSPTMKLPAAVASSRRLFSSPSTGRRLMSAAGFKAAFPDRRSSANVHRRSMSVRSRSQRRKSGAKA